MTSDSPRHRHRSQSRRISHRRHGMDSLGYVHDDSSGGMIPGDTLEAAMAHPCDTCPGALRIGDTVRVFSRSADTWVDGEVVSLVDDETVCLEYEVEDFLCRKVLDLHSANLMIPFDMDGDNGHEEPHKEE